MFINEALSRKMDLTDMKNEMESKIDSLYADFEECREKVALSTGQWFNKENQTALYKNWEKEFHRDLNFVSDMYGNLTSHVKTGLKNLINEFETRCNYLGQSLNINFKMSISALLDPNGWQYKHYQQDEKFISDRKDQVIKECLDILAEKKARLESILSAIPTFEEERRAFQYLIDKAYESKCYC